MMRRPSSEARTLFAEEVVKTLAHGRLRTMRPELREAAREAMIVVIGLTYYYYAGG